MMPAPLFRILHLSDLAFLGDRPAGPIADRLVDAVSRLVDEGLGVDLVAVTGDIATTGAPAEFERAEVWLRDELLPAAGLGPDALLLVPGERDVDVDVINTTTRSTHEACLRTGQKAIGEVLGDPGQRDPMLRRLGAYLAFVNRLRGGRDPLTTPWWHEVREIRGVKVGMAGLCSAWVADRVQDDGRLLVGLRQVEDTLDPLRRLPVRVALLHHPRACLHWQDAPAWQAIERGADVLLGGHPPRGRITRHEFEAHTQVEVAFGATFGQDGEDPCVALVEVHTDGVDVRPYVFHRSTDRWIRDRNTAGNVDGVIQRRGAARPAAASPTATPPALVLRPWPVAPPLPAEPYPVLGPYEHPDCLGGRDADVEEVLALLRGDALIHVLHAPSGAGKSSLLRAGILPRLRGWEGRTPVVVASSSRPAAPGLTRRLAGELVLSPPPLDDGDAIGFAAFLARVRDAAGHPPVVVLDQFEDAFKGDKSALAWLGPLLAASAVAPGGRAARWVLAYRNEFHGEVAAWLGDLRRYTSTGASPALPWDLSAHGTVPWALPLLGDPRRGEDRAAAARAAFREAILRPLRLRDDHGAPRYRQRMAEAAADRLAAAFARARVEDRDAPFTPELQVVLARLGEEAARRGTPTLEVPTAEEDVNTLVTEAIRHHLRSRLDEVAVPGEPAGVGARRTEALLLLARLVDDAGRRRTVPGEELRRHLRGDGRGLLDRLMATGVWLIRGDGAGGLLLPHDRVALEVHRIQTDPEEIIRYGLDAELVELWRLVAQRAAAWPRDPDAGHVAPERMEVLLAREAALPWSAPMLVWWAQAKETHRDTLRAATERRVREKSPDSGEPLRALFLLLTEFRYDGARLARVLTCDATSDEAFKPEVRDRIFGLGPSRLEEEERRRLLPPLVEALAPILDDAVEAESFYGALIAAADNAGGAGRAAVVAAMRAARGTPPVYPEEDWSPVVEGTFEVGCFPGDPGKLDDETLHPVTLSPYRMRRYAESLAEYRAFAKDHLGQYRYTEGWPAFQVNWYEATAYAAWRGGRLPTEAEWEVAARGGGGGYTKTAYYWGDAESDADKWAVHTGNVRKLMGGSRPAVTRDPVPGTPPHPLGLVHVHGNVFEWTTDWFAPYPSEPTQDPTGPAAAPPSARRVIRGGSWSNPAAVARSAYRFRFAPSIRDSHVGLRLVLPQPGGAGS